MDSCSLDAILPADTAPTAGNFQGFEIFYISILGIVGAGGIGFYIINYIKFFEYGKAAVFMLVVLITVVIIPDSIVPLPGWIKSNAGWWINGQSTDQSLLDAFEYMQNKGLIGSYEFSNYSQPHIPNWLKISWFTY